MVEKKQSLDCGVPDADLPTMQYGVGPGEEAVKFESGALRSQLMPYYSAIPRDSLRRLALRATGAPRGTKISDFETGFDQEGGSDKYGYGNWSLGLEMEDTFNHVIDHLYRWKHNVEQGIVDKHDDLAGAAWGIMFPLMKFEREYKAQFSLRNRVMRECPKWTPIEIDEYMRKAATIGRFSYLLKQLAPKEAK